MKTFAMILVLTTALLAGCKSASGPYPATGPKGEPLHHDQSVVYLTRSLQKVLHLTDENVARSPDGRMAVELTFLNTQPKQLDIQVKTTFRTEDGVVTGETGFMNVMLAAHETKQVRVTSMDSRPALYLMQIRRISD